MANEFNVYRGQDGDIDYSTAVATMDLTDTEVEIAAQYLPADTIWHYVRRELSECALESDPSDPCIVQIDDAGDMILDTPNIPDSLTVEQAAGAKLKVRWRYSELAQEIAPTGFRIYIDSGTGFDFDTPDDTVAFAQGGGPEFSWTSSALNNGQTYKFCIRAYTTAYGETQNVSFVSGVAKSSGPSGLTGITGSWEAA
ncbi:hypothetical protein LCGC14_2748840 [marine sediment metagenome]|uniref:Fibronectin type-III domain-containing protein n=1 Tax=marine sediment metagenome TaxID=412755 RepID=A0A0F9BU34_9ZZZZ